MPFVTHTVTFKIAVLKVHLSRDIDTILHLSAALRKRRENIHIARFNINCPVM